MSEQSESGGATRERELLLAFVDIADTLVDDYDVIEVLHRLADYCVSLLGASGASLLLSNQQGGLHVMASSPDHASPLEVQTDQGPSLDAYRTGQLVQIDDLTAAATRWPEFATAALAEGFHTVQAVPLQLRGQIIGALNLFGRETGLGQRNLRVARALADTATIGILQERAIRRGEVLTEQLQRALNSRVIIEQAKGVLSHAAGIPMDQAFQHLRTYCRSHNRRISDVADAIVRGQLAPGVITDAHAPREDRPRSTF
ncbi:GAF and ANTAR domain-containing protein [Saccharomonospora sp. NPDC006951]